MVKVEKIKLYEEELISDVAFCIAYCIGANYDNDEEVANSIDRDEIVDVVFAIREIHEKYLKGR